MNSPTRRIYTLRTANKHSKKLTIQSKEIEMAKGKPVTEAEYDIAKMLLKNTTVSVAAKALGRAPVTVSYGIS